MTIVAAVARNGVIGADGGLPWHLPDELRLFKETTLGHVLVMGRRTYESIGRPLPGRTTVVVTRRRDWSPGTAEVVVAHGIDEALDARRRSTTRCSWSAAASSMRPRCRADRLLLTLVDQEPAGDTTFPDVDWGAWRETARVAGAAGSG